VTAAGNVVKAGYPSKANVVDKITDLVNDLVTSTIGDPRFNDLAQIKTVATDVDGLVKEFYENEILTTAILGLGDLYGKTVRVAFLRYLREERKFATVEALRAQIDRDRETVRQMRLTEENGAV